MAARSRARTTRASRARAASSTATCRTASTWWSSTVIATDPPATTPSARRPCRVRPASRARARSTSGGRRDLRAHRGAEQRVGAVRRLRRARRGLPVHARRAHRRRAPDHRSDFDTVLYVRPRICSAAAGGTSIACNDDPAGSNAGRASTLGPDGGATYYVFLDGASGAAGNYRLVAYFEPR